MKIHLACIVGNDSELPRLKRMIESVRPAVDGVFITANGTDTDAIEKYCKKHDYHYSFFKWCDDFSAVRNFNFEQAKDCDYIFWCDTDDMLIGADKVRDVAKIGLETNKDIIFFTYWYGCTFNGEPSPETMLSVDLQHPRERLIKPGSNTWKGRLHETPVPAPNHNVTYTHVEYSKDFPIAVMHTAIQDELVTKMERNMRILELQLDDEMKAGAADPRTLLYLMKIYNELSVPDLWRKCLEMGREYIGKSGWDMERGVCWDIMAQCISKLGDKRTAIIYWHNAVREWAYDPLNYLHLANGYFEIGAYRQAEHWLNVALRLEPDTKSSGLTNLKGMKVLASEVGLKLNWGARKDINKAIEFAGILFKEVPTEANRTNLAFLYDMKDLTEACERVDKLFEYLESVGNTKSIFDLVVRLPEAISQQPFAIKWLQKVQQPRVWGDKEICYFANMGKHLFKWDGNSVKEGIGGSETAVIRLAEEWTKQGFTVTVYCDPVAPTEVNGVRYLPYFWFNPQDEFNVFIQWRNPQLAGKVKAKFFGVDLHDVFSGLDYTPELLQQIDKLFVKSKWHRKLAPNVPDEKFAVIGNGIDL